MTLIYIKSMYVYGTSVSVLNKIDLLNNIVNKDAKIGQNFKKYWKGSLFFWTQNFPEIL
jgi:hypothetical protein